jgi:hypothetical protein
VTSAPVGTATHECSVTPVSGCEAGAPSFALDVRPILERRCYRCHAGDGVAADEHDFTHLDVLHAARADVANEVASCAMPPRDSLSADEAQTILQWAACGGNTTTTRATTP